jgi:hypothetical protein
LEMLAWIDELYANARPPYADVLATGDLILDITDADEQLLIDFAIDMQADDPLCILVTGQDAVLNTDLHQYKGPVMLKGYGEATSVDEGSILNVGRLPSPISTLFVEDCLLTHPFRTDRATFVNALSVLMLADSIETFRLTVPADVTFGEILYPLQLDGSLPST